MSHGLTTAALGRRSLFTALPCLSAASLLPCWQRATAQTQASAATWPERRVRLITPATPGSSLDLITRLVAERLSARWGQPVVVEGRPGADGIPALEAMLGAPPGEALLSTNHGAITVTPILHPRLGFDPMTEMPSVVDLTADQFGVAVPAALPVRDLVGLIAHARERPGALNYTAAPGPPYLAMRAFLRDAGLDMVFVGYRGVGVATVSEMLAGRLHAMMVPLVPVVGAAREGRLRVIAVTGPERAPALPEVPTSTEQGFPGFRQEGIHGLFGWRGMPDVLRDRIAAEAAAVVADPALAERLSSAGLMVRRGGTPATFAATLAEQRGRWAALAQEFGAAPPS
jgi:tripartite-type tricarboxylate transporter receptor subunit TctC